MAEAKPVRKKNFFKSLRGEFKKIIWPNSSTLIKQIITVIVVTGIVGGIVFLIDLLYQNGVLLLLG